MHRFGRITVAAVCASLWLAIATGVAQAANGAAPAGGKHSIGGTAPALTCSTALRLWDGTGFSGTKVSISERGTWINLSSLGFDNETSSFVVGACSVDLASGLNGSNALYPRCLNPGCQEPTMAPGWNNVISSVFLH